MKTINDLRDKMFEALDALQDGRIDAATAHQIANIGNVIVNSARAEIDYIKTAGGGNSEFMAVGDAPRSVPLAGGGSVKKIGNRTIHRVED